MNKELTATADAHPEKCTGCGWCEWHCPDFAISVKQIDRKEERDGG